MCHEFLLDNEGTPPEKPDTMAALAEVTKELRYDAINANSRELLAMPLLATIPFSAFVLEHYDFLAFALGHDQAMNRCPVNIGLADLDIFAIGK
jgi:hypothetical protein